MDRKKRILQAVRNKKLKDFEFLTSDGEIVLEIIDEFLERNDFASSVYFKKLF